MCVADVTFGQEGLTEQYLSMGFFYDSIFLFDNTMLVSKRALRFQRALSVTAFSSCT